MLSIYFVLIFEKLSVKTDFNLYLACIEEHFGRYVGILPVTLIVGRRNEADRCGQTEIRIKAFVVHGSILLGW
jgi:hypothetical protein